LFKLYLNDEESGKFVLLRDLLKTFEVNANYEGAFKI